MDGHGAAGPGPALRLSPTPGTVTWPTGDPGREAFSARLRRLAESVWRAQHEHLFVRGIGDGSLDLPRFRHWVRRDYRFLVAYCREYLFWEMVWSLETWPV